MDGEPEEFNLFLSLAFGLILFVPLLFAGLIYLLLIRFKVIEFSKNSFFLKIVKGVAFSFGGLFAFLVLFNLVILIIEAVIRFFKK